MLRAGKLPAWATAVCWRKNLSSTPGICTSEPVPGDSSPSALLRGARGFSFLASVPSLPGNSPIPHRPFDLLPRFKLHRIDAHLPGRSHIGHDIVGVEAFAGKTIRPFH